MSTHINAKMGDYADTVLLPGIRCVQNILQKTSWKMLNK